MPVALRLGLLTDKQIHRYMLLGFYGRAAQRRAELEVAMQKKEPKAKKVDVIKDLEQLL